MEVKAKSRFNLYGIWDNSSFKRYIIRRFDIESAKINSIAILIGLLTGLVIGIYDRTLLYFSTLFGMQQGFSVHEFPPYYVVFMPALGGLIVGIISYFMIKRRYGVDGLIETVAIRGAKLNLIDSFLEVFASIITISSGGSLGKEAPGILGGAWTGALVGRILKSPEKRLQILLGCGAAGGIAAVFSAPLAGVVFVVEVIYGELRDKYLYSNSNFFSLRNTCIKFDYRNRNSPDSFLFACQSIQRVRALPCLWTPCGHSFNDTDPNTLLYKRYLFENTYPSDLQTCTWRAC